MRFAEFMREQEIAQRVKISERVREAQQRQRGNGTAVLDPPPIIHVEEIDEPDGPLPPPSPGPPPIRKPTTVAPRTWNPPEPADKAFVARVRAEIAAADQGARESSTLSFDGDDSA